ncbi:peptidoglycan recognition protein [Streptomyces sp. NBC_01498]|uniref:peptidoglycan recognition protein family protein n=1 Tax=Streptomyces sp. NBC_01498 TaxID=2975870 RepID=UPI002E7B6E5F|nr:peptidoglycan recognition protein [Streptomyces sp. NBC_01498]WTL26578.1 peptidoglycan recognition protein [Streptomyces sp. NBC_01498]
MRVLLASSIGVACAAALVLPLSTPSGAAAPRDVRTASDVPGSTESLPLAPLGSERSPGAATEQGLTRRDVQPFSLVGVVWDDADAELNGSVQVRNRSAETGAWSGWQNLETHNAEHGADLGTSERDSGTVRGSTAPLWVGASDGVQVRVRAEDHPDADADADPDDAWPEDPARAPGEAASDAPVAGSPAAHAPETRPARRPLPHGLSLELINPGEAPEQLPVPGAAPSRVSAGGAGVGAGASAGAGAGAAVGQAPRPRIVTRKGWGANEKLREKQFGYTKTVKAAFVHHSATGNNYTCKQAPSVIRGIYRYHVTSSGWRDIGYNFAVDKCGTIYEGRAGGVARPVMGAHTLGFNTNSTGIAVLGSYSTTTPPAAVTTALAKLTAWKLGLHGINPKGKVTLTSAGGNKYAKGRKVSMNAVSGHRDGYVTDCPGNRLYGKLGTVRVSAAKYQGRS